MILVMSIAGLQQHEAESSHDICILSLLFQVRGQAKSIVHSLANVVRSKESVYGKRNDDSLGKTVSVVMSIHDVLDRISADSELLGKMVMAEQRQGVISLSSKRPSFQVGNDKWRAYTKGSGMLESETGGDRLSSRNTHGTKTPSSGDIPLGDVTSRYAPDNPSTEDDTPLSWIYGKGRYRKPFLASSSARSLLRVRSYQNIRQVLSGSDYGMSTPASAVSGKSNFVKNPLLKRVAASYTDAQSRIGMSITPVQDMPRGSDKESSNHAEAITSLQKNKIDTACSPHGVELASPCHLRRNVSNRDRTVNFGMDPCWSDRTEHYGDDPPSKILECLQNRQLLSDITYTAYLPMWWRTSSHAQYMKNTTSRRKSLSVDTIDTRRGRPILCVPARLDAQKGGSAAEGIHFDTLLPVNKASVLNGARAKEPEPREVSLARQTTSETDFDGETPPSMPSCHPLAAQPTGSRWGGSSTDLWSSMSVATSELHCKSLSTKYKQMPSQFYSSNNTRATRIREVLVGCNYTLKSIGHLLRHWDSPGASSDPNEAIGNAPPWRAGTLSAALAILSNLSNRLPGSDTHDSGIRLYLMILFPLLWLLSSALSVVRKIQGQLRDINVYPSHRGLKLDSYLEELAMYHQDLSLFILCEQTCTDTDDGQMLGTPGDEVTTPRQALFRAHVDRASNGMDSNMEKCALEDSIRHSYSGQDAAPNNSKNNVNHAPSNSKERLTLFRIDSDEMRSPIRKGEKALFDGPIAHSCQSAGISSRS